MSEGKIAIRKQRSINVGTCIFKCPGILQLQIFEYGWDKFSTATTDGTSYPNPSFECDPCCGAVGRIAKKKKELHASGNRGSGHDHDVKVRLGGDGWVAQVLGPEGTQQNQGDRRRERGLPRSVRSVAFTFSGRCASTTQQSSRPGAESAKGSGSRLLSSKPCRSTFSKRIEEDADRLM